VLKAYRYKQSKQLTQLKAEFPVYKNVCSQVLQNVLDRLDQAFKNFFRSGFGFPRCKGAKRYDSFTDPQTGFSIGGRRLSLAKIGNVKLRLSRSLPQGAVVKTCTMKRSVQGWFAALVFEHQPVPLQGGKVQPAVLRKCLPGTADGDSEASLAPGGTGQHRQHRGFSLTSTARRLNIGAMFSQHLSRMEIRQ
jgi:putative transposase